MKQEIIDPTVHDNVRVVLMEAMAQTFSSFKDSRFEEIFIKRQPEPGKVSVVVTVNGQEVPFIEALGGAIDKMVGEFDKRVHDEAVKLIAQSPALNKIYNHVQQLEIQLDMSANEIEEELKKVRGW
jgi:hypothetical protein